MAQYGRSFNMDEVSHTVNITEKLAKLYNINFFALYCLEKRMQEKANFYNISSTT